MNMYYNFITRALYLLGAVRDIQMFEMNGGGVVMLPSKYKKKCQIKCKHYFFYLYIKIKVGIHMNVSGYSL